MVQQYTRKVCSQITKLEEEEDLNKSRAGEKAQWLRALTALPEVLSIIPSNHMVAHNQL